jgi:hypothetical protein
MGLPRPVLQVLRDAQLIKTAKVSVPGYKHQIELIHMPTLLRFLDENSALVGRLVNETLPPREIS